MLYLITTTVGKTPNLYIILQVVGVKLIFTGGYISLVVAFKGPSVILGLYKCDYSLAVKQELGAVAR